MVIELEDVAKMVGALLALLGIYALWRKRVQKEVNNERDIIELRKDIQANREQIQANKEDIKRLDEHYKEMVDRLYDNLFGKRK